MDDILLHVLLLANPDLGHLKVSRMIWSVRDREVLTAPNGEDIAVGQSKYRMRNSIKRVLECERRRWCNRGVVASKWKEGLWGCLQYES